MAPKSHTFNLQPGPFQTRRVLGAALKAGFLGGLAVSLLLVVYQFSLPLLQVFLIPPALLIVWIVTGIGAAMSADEVVITSRDGGRVGVIAGLISGSMGGIASMLIAGFGATFIEAGERILGQFSDTQLNSLLESGFDEQLVALSGSIVSALFVCGIGGMVAAALLGGVGGWLYPRFNR
ncbi:MAG: hypothetical protein ACE5G8_17965 [Anaerolineae bacterium]